MTKEIRSILIANRGEIAHRIARTARSLGVRTVGLASRKDPTALHELACDDFVWIEDLEPTEVFLSPETIVKTAKDSKAQAVHPGYGFLSESPALAKACAEAGLTFMGPSPEALALFGDKSATKGLAEKAKVPVLTTTSLDIASKEGGEVVKQLQKEGEFPLLIKARAGGGGRGMRLVNEASELEEQCQSASREAEKFFGDGTLLIEPYLPEIKHIEIQIVGDSKGDVIHLYERECSAQRNYQKILEEAPSCSISESLKEKLYRDSVALCKQLTYQGLGTVEFLVTPDEKYYFTEVNPRLQVEHPVTEEILGVDLVALQFHVAEGKPLKDYPTALDELTPIGHAIQARVNAESSLDFSPRIGDLTEVSYPMNQTGMRVESGVRSGSTVSPFFDSLIMKCIQMSASRIECTQQLSHFLTELHLVGVETNLPFLTKVLESPSWLNGSYTTSLTSALKEQTPPKEELSILHALAALISFITPAHQTDESSWYEADSFRTVGRASRSAVASVEQETYSLEATILSPSELHVSLKTEEEEKALHLNKVSRCSSNISFSLSGSPVEHFFVKEDTAQGSTWIRSQHFAGYVTLSPPSLKESDEERSELARTVRSPLPGTIIKVLSETGSSVKAGDTLFLLESMKMEHPVKSKVDGVLDTISIKEGDSVSAGQELASVGN